MGHKDFVDGDPLLESDLDDLLMRQMVMRFATSSARNSALSGVLTEGLHTTQADANCDTVYSGSAWSTVGPLYGAPLATYDPTVTQGGGGIAHTTVSGYWRLGRLVIGHVRVTLSGSGSSGSALKLTTPVTSANALGIFGTGRYVRGGGSPFSLKFHAAFDSTATTVQLHDSAILDIALGDIIGINPAFGAASGDAIHLLFAMEASADA